MNSPGHVEHELDRLWVNVTTWICRVQMGSRSESTGKLCSWLIIIIVKLNINCCLHTTILFEKGWTSWMKYNVSCETQSDPIDAGTEMEKTWDDQCLNQNAKFVKIPIKLKANAELSVIWYGPVQQPLLRLAHCWQECEKKRRCPAILSIDFPVSPNHILSLVHIAQQRVFPFYRWDRSTPMDEADHKNENFSRSTFHFFSLTKYVCRRMRTDDVHSVCACRRGRCRCCHRGRPVSHYREHVCVNVYFSPHIPTSTIMIVCVQRGREKKTAESMNKFRSRNRKWKSTRQNNNIHRVICDRGVKCMQLSRRKRPRSIIRMEISECLKQRHQQKEKNKQINSKSNTVSQHTARTVCLFLPIIFFCFCLLWHFIWYVPRIVSVSSSFQTYLLPIRIRIHTLTITLIMYYIVHT